MNRQERIHDVRPTEVADRIALALAFFLGAGGILFFKIWLPLLISDHVPLVAAAIWASLILFFYVVAVWLLGALRIEPETIGDNCYYLGFVYTLTSLAVTLYQISGDTIGGSAVQDTISGFGVALSSTIVGIVLRVWLLRLRPDIVARDRAARIELQAAARTFRASLASSSTIIKSHAVETTQLMAEERKRLHGIVEETITAHREAMRSGAEAQLKMLEKTLSEGAEKSAAAIAMAVESAVNTASIGMTDQVASIRKELADFTSAEAATLKKLAGDAADVSQAGAQAAASLDAASKSIAGMALKFEETSSLATKRLAAAADAIDSESASVIIHLRASFEGLREAAANVGGTDHLDRVIQSFEAAADSISNSSKGLSQMDEDRAEQFEMIAKSIANAVASIDNAVKRVEVATATFPKEGAEEKGQRSRWWSP